MSLNVLSLFDGISCGRVALKRAGIPVANYYSSEIDKYALKVAGKNWPEDSRNRLGDVSSWREWDLPNIDLMLGGFPCTTFSLAGKQAGFEDPRGRLFFDMVDIFETVRPRWYLFENTEMKPEYKRVVNDIFGEPTVINSKDFSAQQRKRLYWTNIPIADHQDKGITFQSILERDEARLEKAYAHVATYYKKGGEATRRRHFERCQRSIAWIDDENTRWLTPLECERLQTLDDGYTDCLSNTQRYITTGNGWTVDVIAHILRGAK